MLLPPKLRLTKKKRKTCPAPLEISLAGLFRFRCFVSLSDSRPLSTLNIRTYAMHTVSIDASDAPWLFTAAVAQLPRDRANGVRCDSRIASVPVASDLLVRGRARNECSLH